MDSNHTCLIVSSLNSALKNNEIYYPQLSLKDSKYGIRHIIDNLKSSSEDFDKE